MQPRSRVPGGGVRSGSMGISVAAGRNPAFCRSHRYSGFGRGNSKSFLPPPPLPPPLPTRKYEVLMEAGRLAAEYLVGKGVLPPSSLPRSWPNDSIQEFKGQLRLNPPYLEGRAPSLARLEGSPPNAGRGQKRFNDDYDHVGSRKKGKGWRKTGFYNRGYQDWGRERGRNGQEYMERSRSYSDSLEDDEDAAPGYRRDRRTGNDEVGSSVSGVAGDQPPSKNEGMGDSGSEVEDTGSKVSPGRTIKDPRPEGDSAIDMKIEADSDKVLNSDAGEVKSAENPEPEKDSSEEAADDKTCNTEKDSHGKPRDNLLKLCGFAKVPTKPRSVLAHKSPGQNQHPVVEVSNADAVAEGGATKISDVIDGLNRETVADSGSGGNQPVESTVLDDGSFESRPAESSLTAIDVKEENSFPNDGTLREVMGESDISPPLASQEDKILTLPDDWPMQDSLVETLSQDEMVESVDQEKVMGAESHMKGDEENQDQPTSFKICDLNLVQSPEVTEIPDDHDIERNAASRANVEPQKQPSVDFGLATGKSVGDSHKCSQLPGEDKVVPVIDIEDDSPAEFTAGDSSKPKTSVMYPSLENMLNHATTTDVLQGGYSLAISDYLGADISCYPSIQADLQAGISLHVAEGITGVDDPIYGSLGDIGFMEVWDQPPQDYEKFF